MPVNLEGHACKPIYFTSPKLWQQNLPFSQDSFRFDSLSAIANVSISLKANILFSSRYLPLRC